MKRFTKVIIVFVCAVLLSGCHSSWNVKVDLTPEERQATELEIGTMRYEIKNFKGAEGEIPWKQIIRLSQAYEKQGEMDKAIKTYTDVLKGGKKTSVMMNNLGRLYEKVGEFDLAVAQYKRIVDEYFDTNYLYDITWAYIHAAQASKGTEALKYRKEAEKVFNAWQNEFRKTDEQTQQEIKKLREAEQAAK